MPRLFNRGFASALLILIVVAELLLRVAAGASPSVVRVVYGTTLAMYMEVDRRLRDAAPDVEVLAIGDSLSLTQFQPDIYAADHGLPSRAVFNASLLAQTFRSHESLLQHIGVRQLPRLRQALVFVNPRRLTAAGNVDAEIFRVAIPDREGTLAAAWRERSVSPLFDRSRLYGLSRYLVGASWRQIGRPDTWDQVEYLMPNGGIAFDRSRPPASPTFYPYNSVTTVDDRYVEDLRRLVAVLRARDVTVVMLPPVHHPLSRPFVDGGKERYYHRMQALAAQTGARWVPLPIEGFTPPSDEDFLDYGHLNRAGGIAFTHWLRDAASAIE